LKKVTRSTFDPSSRCSETAVQVSRPRIDADHGNRPLMNQFPNVFGAYAFYHLGK